LKIYPIVEGHGEVTAVPVLLRRLVHDHAHCYQVQIGAPLRRTESAFRREADVQNSVRLALAQEDCAGILLLCDGEDDCPVERGAQIGAWARNVADGVPLEVVIAYREYETWFLSAIESLRGHCNIALDAAPQVNPEARRDAKGTLEEYMRRGASYSPAIHQARLSAVFDLAVAHRRNRSFRKFAKAVGNLLRGAGQTVDVWPPAHWQ
jgi:hypothetical protein